MPAGSSAPLLQADPTADAVLGALDPEQREVATALRGPVCVLAGAGTGKTRAITSRIAYGVLSGALRADRVLAVTFTTRAAGEMRSRLRALGAPGVQALTFHAAARRQLAYFWPRVVGGPLPALAETKAPLVAAAADRCRVGADRLVVRDLAAEVEWAKVSSVAPDAYVDRARVAGRMPPVDPESCARVYAAYEDVKRERGLIDFEDILLLTVGVLSERDDVAREVRDRYRHLVVDEYQDVNPLQQRLLELWLGDGDDVCVVGDPSQTIYSFTGASPSHLLDFPRRHPGAQVIRLVRDYRSTPQVVALANALLSQATGAAAARRLELVAQRPAGPGPRFVEYDDEPGEADGVAADVRRLLATGVRASEIAVLYRINAQSETFEQAFAAAGIPYVVRGGERFFQRREVRDALVLLRGGAAGSASAVADADAPQPPEGGLSGEVRSVLAGAGWQPEPPAATGAVRDRWASLDALVHLADDLAATRPQAGLRDFVAELEERAQAQHAPTVEGVTLASLHAAKGLEWDAVFLVGLTDGMVPIVHAVTPEQVEEERRLLYVGMTRAREHLCLSWALARTPGSRGGRSPSRFLDHLRPAGQGAAAGPATARPARRASRGASAPPRCRICRKPLGAAAERKIGRCEACPADLDEGLLDRLRTWRTDRARAQSLPAYCVFTDATLVAIAETRPQTTADLARVPGVGTAKLDKYGAEVLDLCSDTDAGA